MIPLTNYSGKKIGVFGLGKAGEATIAALLAGGAEVFAWDDKAVDGDKKSFHQLPSIIHYQHWPWKEIVALVLSPGVPLTHPAPHPVVTIAKQNNCPIIGDIDLLYGACPQARYIGITGTNGKSTTTTLIGHILKSCGVKTEIGGNLGTAALSLNRLDEDGVYVLELSSYQLDLMHTARMNVAVLLNITPDHLDRHGDMEGYVRAKQRIFKNQRPDDTAVVAVDDEWSGNVIRGAWFVDRGINAIAVSSHQLLKRGVCVQNGILHDTYFTHHEPRTTNYDLSSIQTLTGRHNWQNAAAAYAAARAIGLAPDDIYRAMQSFAGLRHRMQLVAAYKNMRFINDSKATNADATANALAPYTNIYWIAGGKPKAGGIETLEPFFPHIAHAFLIGEAEAEFAATLEGKVSYTRCGTLAVAVEKAADMAQRDGKKDAVVLLSPACASFDQWKSFEHRGDAFCDYVNSLPLWGRGGVGALAGDGANKAPLPASPLRGEG